MKIRKLALCALILVTSLALAGTARAQVGITLSSTGNAVHFQGMGPGDPNQLSISFGHCSRGVCSTYGRGTGSGLAASNGWFTLSSPLGSMIATLVNATTGQWAISQTAPILFSYGHNGTLLTGDLDLLTFQEAPGTSTGTFNYDESANLQITGGSLASVFGSDAIMQVYLTFRTTVNLESLLGKTTGIEGAIAGGEVLPTPEPSAFAIFGLGSVLLLIGSLLRRKRAASRTIA